VTARSGWAFPAVSPTQQSNGYDCGGGEVLWLPSPPSNSGDAVGKFCLVQNYSYTPDTVNGGPNAGWQYMLSLSGGGTSYNYVISPDLLNSGSAFYQAQCGNYNAQTTPNGFISGANLLANTTRHESGTIQSHYQNYVVVQSGSNNLGTKGEALVAPPGADFGQQAQTALQGAWQSILSATQVEPCGVMYNGSCTFQGYINFYPYVSCP
jgi:hypothetical protein